MIDRHWNDNATLVLFVVAGLVLCLVLSAIIYGMHGLISLHESSCTQDSLSASCQERIFYLYSQGLLLSSRIFELENELSMREKEISYLKARLGGDANYTKDQRIGSHQLRVYPDRVILHVNGTFPVLISNSSSMHPYLNRNALALELRPSSTDDLKVGDIIGYQSKIFNTSIIHRIISIGEDEQGWFSITKGDANLIPDPEKVRFQDVEGVIVGLIY